MMMRHPDLRDPAFRSLGTALDPARAGQAFVAALADHGFVARRLECRIERVRHKPGAKALIAYRLSGTDQAGHAIDQRVMLSLFPEGTPARLANVAADDPLVEPAFGPPTARLPELDGQAWFFPNDRKLHHIGDLLGDLPAAIRAAGRVTERRIVHYVPEQGCTIRLTLDSGATYYGKCRADDRGMIAAAVSRAASATPRPDPAVRLAPSVAYDPHHRIFWQHAVAGRPLDPAAVVRDPDLWASRACEALAAFAALPRPLGLKQLAPLRTAHSVVARALRLSPLMPQLGARLDALGARLGSSCPTTGDPVLLHGDLHPGNMLWDGASFALIDLDTAAVGARGFDHGSLVAALVHQAIEQRASDEPVDRLIAAFRRAAGLGAEFDWYVAAALVAQRLYRCGTRHKSPSIVVRERLLATAERLVRDA